MKLWKIVFTIWVFLWALFLVRGFIKGEFEEFKALCCSDKHEKLSYILGSNLNSFRIACQRAMPMEATYNIVGDLDEHNKFRFIYYLYPRRQSEDPNYILDIDHKNHKYILKHLN